MPIKKFFNGDVLTAEEVNTYLMDQSIVVFPNETARDLAFSDTDPALPELGGGGRLCYLADRQVVQYFSGELWVDSGQFTVADDFITNAKINTNAGIVDTKLSTISTAGKVANSATTATSSNTASAIVARDSSGNFSAGAITVSSASASGAISAGSISVSGNAVYHISTASVASGGSISTSNDGQLVELTGNNATLTVPGTGWIAGSQITIMQMGTGSASITFTGATDIKATPRVSASVVALRTQYSTATIINRGTSDWYVIGDLRS